MGKRAMCQRWSAFVSYYRLVITKAWVLTRRGWVRELIAVAVLAAGIIIVLPLYGLFIGRKEAVSEVPPTILAIVGSMVVVLLALLINVIRASVQIHEEQTEAIKNADRETDRVIQDKDEEMRLARTRHCEELHQVTAERDAAIAELNKPKRDEQVELVKKRLRHYADTLRGYKREKRPDATTERIDQRVTEIERPVRKMLEEWQGLHHAGDEVGSRRVELRDEWLECKAKWLEERANTLVREDINVEFLQSALRL